MRRIDKDMNNLSKKLLILTIPMVMALSGCMPERECTFYVDPTYGQVTYEDLSRPPEPPKWKIVAKSFPNGLYSDTMLFNRIHQVLKKSGVAIPVDESYDAELKVVFNCLTGPGYVTEKVIRKHPFGSFGKAKHYPTNYEMEIELIGEARTTIERSYKHTIHSTPGFVSGPEGVESCLAKGREAEGRVIDEMMLTALKDIEQ